MTQSASGVPGGRRGSEADGQHAQRLRPGDVGAGRVAHVGGLCGRDSQGREGALEHARVGLGEAGLV